MNSLAGQVWPHLAHLSIASGSSSSNPGSGWKPPLPHLGHADTATTSTIFSQVIFLSREYGQRTQATYTTQPSHHVQLADRPACGYPFITEGREIDRAIAAMHDQLGDGAADGGRLLDAVAREAGGEDQAFDAGMPTDDAVLVEGVVLVVAGPGIYDLDCLEGRHARGQNRPHHVVPFLVLDLQRRAGRVVAVGRRRAADIEAALRPEPGARGIDDQRHRARRLATLYLLIVEHEHRAPARLDRQRDPGQCRHVA